MGTRCNLVFLDADTKREDNRPDQWSEVNHPLTIYRHYDGYPEGVAKDLDELVVGLKAHDTTPTAREARDTLFWIAESHLDDEARSNYARMGKTCAYENTDWGIHGDIEYLYVIDCNVPEWTPLAWRSPENDDVDLWPILHSRLGAIARDTKTHTAYWSRHVIGQAPLADTKIESVEGRLQLLAELEATRALNRAHPPDFYFYPETMMVDGKPVLMAKPL